MLDPQSKQHENSADSGFTRLLGNGHQFISGFQASSCPPESLFPPLNGEEIGPRALQWPSQPSHSLTLWSLCLLWFHSGHRATLPKVQHPECLYQREPGCLPKTHIPWPYPGLLDQNWGKGGGRQESLLLQAPQMIGTLKFKNHQYNLIRTIPFHFESPISQLFLGWQGMSSRDTDFQDSN